MLHPEMVKGGYDERFSAATAAAGGTVGIIIPPSIIFIVYGFLMNLPISDLFVAGIIPGALMVIGMMLACLDHLHDQRLGLPDPAATEPGPENRVRRMAGLLCHRSGAVGHLHRQVFPDRSGGCDRRLLYHRRAVVLCRSTR